MHLSGGADPTMSSREIAELVEARHDNVKVTIERLSEKAIVTFTAVQEKSSGGRPGTVYHVNKRDSFVVVAQLCPQFTARLVDRWQELEEQKASGTLALPDFADPGAAARAWAEQYEANRALQIESQGKDALIGAMQPKVEAFDSLMNAEGLYGLQNAGRVLGARPNLFIRWLKQDFLFYQGSALVARMEYRQRGYFEVKTKVIDEKARPETFVTPKGLEWLRGKIPANLLIGGRA
ncbi:hypothetical protein IE00_05935 [Paracoccus sp. SM22M-07]|nr:hypothetical protein IE00_05935 [Paracoccus sp. SM22M-07]